MSDSDRPGQPSTVTPDYLPGWVTMNSGGEVREAVRYFEDGGFPIAFLRPGESVGPAKPPQEGVTISVGKLDFALAVPPDYWVLRDNQGQLGLYADSDFRRGWTRQQWPWRPAVERLVDNPHLAGPSDDPNEIATPYDESIARAARRIDTAQEIPSGRPAAAERNLHGAEDIPGTRDLEVERDAERSEPRRPATAERLAEGLARGAGWMGEQPAAGTRRHLILTTIVETLTEHDGFDGTRDEIGLILADAIESALLCKTIDEEARERGADIISGGIESVDPRLAVGRIGDPRVPQGRSGGSVAKAIAEDAEREADAQNAIANVGEVLDAIDAPQAPTYAQRIQRLFGVQRKAAQIADVERRIARGRLVDFDRVHNLLDGWGILRHEAEDPDVTRSLHQRVCSLIERLRRTEEDLDTEQHRPMVALEGRVAPGTKELHVVLADDNSVDHHRTFFVELEDQDGRSVGGFESRQGNPGLRHIVIPYGRDDEWVQRVAMAAIIAGQDVDRPFPAEALDELLRSFGILPTLPREWPDREATKAVLELSPEEAIAAVDRVVVAAEEADEFDDDEDDDEAEYVGEAYEDRLLRQREEAREGESRFAEERNAAFALLRWLLPVYVTKRMD